MVVTFKLSSGAKWVSVAFYEAYITEKIREGGSKGVMWSKKQREKGFTDY